MEDKQKQASQAFLQNYHFVEKMAFRFAPSQQLQDDIVQDAFVDFVQKAEQWDLTQPIQPLLKRIVQISADRYWRSHMRNKPENLRKIAELLQSESCCDDSSVTTQEQLDALDTCLKKLAEKARILFEQHYFEEIPWKEIAQATGQSVESVYMAGSRIRAVLRECIDHVTGWEMKRGD
ncbi:MAG: sigma-70 family RNA polymerase sigma factor [Planctomycetia bacterium]|nr:sigma-70 family RNA polymerase sigma factor [Planctomycetia bacterium]